MQDLAFPWKYLHGNCNLSEIYNFRSRKANTSKTGEDIARYQPPEAPAPFWDIKDAIGLQRLLPERSHFCYKFVHIAVVLWEALRTVNLIQFHYIAAGASYMIRLYCKMRLLLPVRGRRSIVASAHNAEFTKADTGEEFGSDEVTGPVVFNYRLNSCVFQQEKPW